MVFIDVWHVTRADSPADKSSHTLKVMLASQISGELGNDLLPWGSAPQLISDYSRWK
jgi:hypothetical protein